MKVFGHVGPAVDDDAGLQFAKHGVNLVGLPTEAPLIRLTLGPFLPPGAGHPVPAKLQPVLLATVEEQDVDLSVVGQEFPHLPVILVAHRLGVFQVEIGKEETGKPPI